MTHEKSKPLRGSMQIDNSTEEQRRSEVDAEAGTATSIEKRQHSHPETLHGDLPPEVVEHVTERHELQPTDPLLTENPEITSWQIGHGDELKGVAIVCHGFNQRPSSMDMVGDPVGPVGAGQWW